MFLQKQYEQRLKFEQQEETSCIQENLRQNKIGSVRNKRINYDQDEHFFQKEDIPIKTQETVKQIKDLIDPDVLGLRKRQWNNSVFCPKNPLLEETFERKMIKIKLGLIDPPIPVSKGNKIYVGVETRNNYTGWNVSVEQDLKERALMLNEDTKLSMMKTKLKQNQLIKQYQSGYEQQSLIQATLRQKKKDEKEVRDEIRKDYLFQYPTASKEKTDGAVFRIAYEKTLGVNQQEYDNPECRFKPDLSKTLKHELYVKSSHPGVWQQFSFPKKVPRSDDEEIEVPAKMKSYFAWSCCLNQDQNSDGCNKVIKDKNKWNLVSINS